MLNYKYRESKASTNGDGIFYCKIYLHSIHLELCQLLTVGVSIFDQFIVNATLFNFGSLLFCKLFCLVCITLVTKNVCEIKQTGPKTIFSRKAQLGFVS